MLGTETQRLSVQVSSRNRNPYRNPGLKSLWIVLGTQTYQVSESDKISGIRTEISRLSGQESELSWNRNPVLGQESESESCSSHAQSRNRTRVPRLDCLRTESESKKLEPGSVVPFVNCWVSKLSWFPLVRIFFSKIHHSLSIGELWIHVWLLAYMCG